MHMVDCILYKVGVGVGGSKIRESERSKRNFGKGKSIKSRETELLVFKYVLYIFVSVGLVVELTYILTC